MKKIWLLTLIVFAFTAPVQAKPAMKLSSPDGFYNNAIMPLRFTCNGHKLSPPLKWKSAPKDTKSFVLICEDPDASKVWDHWLLYNIPGDVKEIDEGAHELPQEAKEGLNSWGETGYGAPCPPDREHRYVFKLYALNKTLEFEKAPHKQDLLKAMEGHILDQAELIGRYNQPHNR